jgi:hypothetical protein
MKRSLKKGLPGGPNEKVFSKEGYRSTSPDVNNSFNFIPSGNITMKEKDGTPLKKGPLLGIDNLGNSKLMLPGANYQFPGDVVKEVPLAKKGGPFQNSNIYATNKLFAKNPLFKKRKKGKKAKGIYNPKAKYTYQPGGQIEYNQLPNNYKDALKNFVYPEVVDSSEETGYDAAMGVIKQNPNDPIANVNNPWWMEHELFHHLQNQAGAMSTYGTVGQRPNPYVASDEAIGSYYDRRGAEFDIELNKIFEQNPNISEEEAYALAEENLYRNPTSVEGEARNYEGYIEAGNPSMFNKKADGGESGCPDGKVWSNKFKKCVHLIQHEDYFNSPSMNNYGDVPVISSDPIQSLGDLGPDGLTENILEFFDASGVLSYDDAEKAYGEWQNSKNTHPTFNQSLSMFGAVPGLGKLGKIKYLKNIGPFSKAAFGIIPWQKILNAVDTGQDIETDNINPSIKKTKKSEWNPPLIKREVVVKPKKAFGGEAACPEGFYNDPVKGCVAIEDPNTFYKYWFQNRVMPTAEGQKLLDKVRPEALERASQSVPYIYTEELNPNEAGYYDPETQQIFLNKFLPEAQIEATKHHEFGHHVQGDKFYDVLGKPHQYLIEQNIVGPKEINTGNPEWNKNLKKNYDDVTAHEELWDRVMTLRRDAGFEPNQVITVKDVEDFFKRKKEAGEALDPDIEDLKGVTKGNKSIVNLLNDMVSVPSNREDLNILQFGGPKGQCPLGFVWNGIDCIPNPFETRPSQRAAVYMDKDGTYKMDPVYQQYSQQKFDVAESNRKAQDFNKMYAQSKNYERLLKKQGYTPKEIKDRINSIMNINDIRYTDEGPSWVGADENTGKEFISYNVTDPGDWPGFDQIAAHEWGHVGVDSGANPLKPKEREEFINRINKEQAGVTGNPDDLVHDMEPQENRADLLQLRQQLQEAGVFDSTKRKKFTKKDLKKYKEAMKSSERNWDNMWNRMFRLYDDDSIIYFMNNVAKNNSNEDLQVAKYGFELDLTEDEIQKYVKGGYVVEDISVPSLTRMQPGGPVPDSTYTPIDPNFLAENPDTYSKIVNKPEVTSERQGSDIGKLRAEFREKNPMDIFLDEKKRQFLKKNKGLNKAAGNTMEKFPEDVLQNFIKEYEYKTNNYAVNKLGKKEGWNPKRRGEWVDELTPGERDAVAESKYGSKLQPTYWSRTLAGLGTLVSKFSPEVRDAMNKGYMPGLTKKESQEILNAKMTKLPFTNVDLPFTIPIGGLESLSFAEIPGTLPANYIKNTGLSTGSDYKELPSWYTGEKMANVEDKDVTALNLLTYAGLEAIPELGVNLVKGIRRAISAAPEAISNLKAFKSEIDWRDWVKYKEDFDNNPNVIQELNDIEKANKEAGTWMKNADGTPFQGTPEQFVVQQSTNWKNAFPEYYGETLTTRSNNQFDIFDESKFGATDEGWYGKGIYTYPTQEAKQKGLGTIYGSNEYDLYVNSANKGFVDESLEGAAEMYQKNTDQLFNDLKANNEDYIKKYGSNELTERLVKESYDDLLKKIKAAEENDINQYTTLTVPFSANETVIPFSNRVKSAKGNILFDMTNPNMYKAMLPYIIPAGLGVGAASQMQGQESNASFKEGGIVSNLTKKEIDNLIKQGYIIEEID